MTRDDDIDARIGAALREAASAPDELFVRQVERRVAAEVRIAAGRRTVWARFAWEACASGAVLAAFVLLGRITPAAAAGASTPASPAIAAILLIGFWFAVELSAAPSRR
jgi:hypothetical protein